VYRLHSLLRRRIDDPAPFAATVTARAARIPELPLPELVPELRDRLRRAPLSDDLLAECFGLYCVARGDAPPARVLGAARALMHGRIIELADREERRSAIALAAAAMALHGTPVHLLAASVARANALAQAIQAPFAALGFRVARVTPGGRQDACSRLVLCGTLRDIGLDYLRDRIALDRGPGSAPGGPGLSLLGMQCALVEDSDEVMLDDADAPLMVATRADRPGEQLLRVQITVRGVLGRYLHLAGMCGDARGIESQFWRLYRLKTVRAG
jgi:preprotein translocase subunit SecA